MSEPESPTFLAGRFESVEAAFACATTLLAPWTTSTSSAEPNRLDVSVGVEGLHPAVAALQEARWGRLSAITGVDLTAPPAAAKPQKPAGAAARPAPAGAAAPARPATAVRSAAAAPTEPPTTDLEALYHFSAGGAVLSVRVRVPRGKPELPTICDLVPYAGFYEAELSELFGITVIGTPSLDHLILPDDWPADIFPLRKDAVLPKPPVYLRAGSATPEPATRTN